MPRDEFGDLAAAVGLHDRRDDVGAALQPAMRLAEHGAGLADARGRAEVDAQVAASLRWQRWASGSSRERSAQPVSVLAACDASGSLAEVTWTSSTGKIKTSPGICGPTRD